MGNPDSKLFTAKKNPEFDTKTDKVYTAKYKLHVVEG